MSTTPATPWLEIPAFSIGKFEVTYELWYAVYTWAINNEYTFSDATTWTEAAPGVPSVRISTGRGIRDNGGKAEDPRSPITGSERLINKYMPVHGIDWIDAVVWCNAYNELLYTILYPASLPGDFDEYPYTSSTESSSGTGYYEPLKSVFPTFSLPVTTPPSEKILSPSNVRVGIPSSGVPIIAYRLPTETQWEFAARGGAPGTGAWIQTYAGSNVVDTVAYWEGLLENGVKHPVWEVPMTKKPVVVKGGDVYHMSGNVWEWCLSDDTIIVDDPTSTSTPPAVKSEPTIQYLKRGGGFNDNAQACELNSEESKWINAKDVYSDTGFRLIYGIQSATTPAP
jgi:formylglycine-generating enzyme required for sulfatase activity